MKRSHLRNHFSILLFVFIFVSALSVFAGPGKTTYQAKIVKPDGYPLEVSSVNFKFTILDPAGSCVLYSETYSSVNMSSTGGLISFALGSGVKTYPVSATTFEQVFSNIAPSLSCDTGGPVSYSPSANDIRKIVMQFHDGSGWQTLPAMSINAVPYAMYANEATKLNGLTSSDFVQLSTVPTCAASEALRYTGASFTCVAVGNSVTSSTVVTALGYTPADGASVTALSSSLSTTNSNVSSVSSTVFSVSSTVTSLQNSVAVSFAAITSSQWTTSGSAIYYNTGNVGIGTAGPGAKLVVDSTVMNGAIAIFNSSNTGSGLGIYTSYADVNARNWGLRTNDLDWGDFTLVRSNAQGGNPFSAGTRILYINGSGNVGIGTPTPTAKLHLPSGTSSNASLKLTSGTLLTSPQSGTIEYDGFNFYLTDSTNTRRAIAANTNPGTYDNVSNINSSGNITLTPTGSVVVSSTTASTNSSTGAMIVKGGLGVAGNLYSSGTIVTSSNIQGVSITATSGMISPYIAGSVASGGSLTLDSTTHSSKGNILLAPGGGNVGIGTTTPTSKLHLYGGNVNFQLDDGNGIANLQKTSTDLRIATQTALPIWFATNGTERLRIDSIGNVGIGTTTPDHKMRVIGKIKVGTETDNVSANLQSDVNDVLELVSPNAASAPAMSFHHRGLHTVQLSGFGTSVTNQGLRIKSGPGEQPAQLHVEGKVGVGTTNPQSLLQLGQSAMTGSPASTVEARRLSIATNTHTGATFDFFERDTPANANLDIRYAGASSTILTLTHTGNVGIGASSPTNTLDVLGTGLTVTRNQTFGALATFNKAYTAVSNEDPYMQFRHQTSDGGAYARYGYIQSGQSHNGLLLQGENGAGSPSYLLLNKLGGNVGIGTTTPTTNLQIGAPFSGVATGWVSSRMTGLMVGSDSDNVYFGLEDQGSNNKYGTIIWGDDGSEPFLFQTNDANGVVTERIRITGAGSVGIGTSAPTQRLDVVGTVKATAFAGDGSQLTNIPGSAIQYNDWGSGWAGGAVPWSSYSYGMSGWQDYTGTATGLSNFWTGWTTRNGATGAQIAVNWNVEAGSTGSVKVRAKDDTNGNWGTWRDLAFTDASVQKSGDSMTGSLAVGTSAAPGYTLDVNGDIRITGTPWRAGGDIAWTVPSDARLKNVKRTYGRGLKEILNIDTIIYTYKKDNIKQIDPAVEFTGVLAQNVQANIPEAVKEDKDGFLSLNTTPIFWAMINAIKDLYHEITGVQREIASLKEENKAKDQEIKQLKERLDRIEKALQQPKAE